MTSRLLIRENRHWIIGLRQGQGATKEWHRAPTLYVRGQLLSHITPQSFIATLVKPGLECERAKERLVDAIEIREMREDDHAGLLALWRASPHIGLREQDDSREGLARFLWRNPHCSFVAEKEGEIVGSILCGHDGRRGHLYHVCVRGDCQNLGVGSKMLALALDALRREGISRACLFTFAANKKGEAFWQGHGWEKRPDLEIHSLPLAAGGQASERA